MNIILLCISLLTCQTGEPTSYEQFAEQVKERTYIVRNEREEGMVVSTGFLLSPRHILTCAHGVSDYTKKDTVINYSGFKMTSYVEEFASSSDLKAISIGLDSNQFISISKIHIHPLYAKHRYYDLAILELSEPIPIEKNRNIEIIPPMIGDTILSLGYSGHSKLASHKSLGKNNMRPWLNVVTEMLIEKEKSFEMRQKEEFLTGSLKFGRIIHPGDSGGPSFVKKNQQFYLTGVHIHSVTTIFDDSGQTPEGFVPYCRDASLWEHRDWIKSITEK